MAAERVKLLPLPAFSTNNESENSGGMDDSGDNEVANDDNSGTKSGGNGPEESPKAGGSSNAPGPKVSKVGTSRRNGSGPRSGTGLKATNAGGKRPAPKGPTAGPSSKKTNLGGAVNDKDPQVFLEMYNNLDADTQGIVYDRLTSIRHPFGPSDPNIRQKITNLVPKNYLQGVLNLFTQQEEFYQKKIADGGAKCSFKKATNDTTE